MLVKGSFEDYLYILIGVIWVAFSIYKGAKKKKSLADSPEKTETEKSAESGKSFFDAFLDQIVTENEAIPYEPVEVEEPFAESRLEARENEEKIFSYDDVVEESNFMEENSVYKIEPATEISFQQELKSHLKGKNKQTRFDLRKAVIYSEILNRRYF
jgi:hypothetical protein